jgi:O-antigen/teichoic acid export membrane protein
MANSKSLNIKIGIVLSLVSLIVNILIYIFYTPFLLKIVGDTQYGLYSFAIGITSWFSFASSSMAVSYVRYFAVSKDKKSKFNNSTLNGAYIVIFALYSLLILLASAVFVVLILTRVIVFDKYSSSEQNLITVLFIITILSLIPTLLFQVFSSSIYANGKLIWFRLASILSIILRTGISIPFLLAGCNIIAVVIIHGVVNALFILADILYAYFGLKLRFSFKKILQNKLLFKEIFLFTGALLINEVADRLNASLDSIILGVNGLAVEVTRYALGMRIADYLIQAVLTIAKNFAPTINENAVSGKHDANINIFVKISKIQLILTTLFIGGFCICGKEFILMWLGKGYEDVYYVCIILSILYSYISTTVVSEDIERANNKH